MYYVCQAQKVKEESENVVLSSFQKEREHGKIWSKGYLPSF